jgi:hypothetical protein
MTNIFDDVISDLHNSFMQIYQAKTSSLLTAPILAYEPIGIPISDAMFKLNPTDAAYNTNLALERFSNMTNVIGVVTDGTFQDTGRKLDNMLEELALAPAMPASGFIADVFGKIKNDALKMFDPTLGSSVLGQDARFHPTYATPNNWYDPTVTGNWHTYSSAASKTTVPPVGPRPPIPVSFQRGWQILPITMTPVLEQHPTTPPSPVARPMPTTRVPEPPLRPVATRPVVGIRPAVLAFGAPSQLATASFARTTTLRPSIAEIVASPAQHRVISPERELSTAVLLQTTPQPVTTSSMTITFEYCLVTAERDWLSDAFLASKDWYIPGLKAGELSSGTVENNTGLIPFLPIAMILVRKLNISGSWTGQDADALSTAAALGPFNLMGRSINQQNSSLSCTGMQLLAWLCQVQPMLPPESDPALVTTTAVPAPVATAPPTTAAAAATASSPVSITPDPTAATATG